MKNQAEKARKSRVSEIQIGNTVLVKNPWKKDKLVPTG